MMSKSVWILSVTCQTVLKPRRSPASSITSGSQTFLFQVRKILRVYECSLTNLSANFWKEGLRTFASTDFQKKKSRFKSRPGRCENWGCPFRILVGELPQHLGTYRLASSVAESPRCNSDSKTSVGKSLHFRIFPSSSHKTVVDLRLATSQRLHVGQKTRRPKFDFRESRQLKCAYPEPVMRTVLNRQKFSASGKKKLSRHSRRVWDFISMTSAGNTFRTVFNYF